LLSYFFFVLCFSLNRLALHFLHFLGLLPSLARLFALHFMQIQTFLKILLSASGNLAKKTTKKFGYN